MIILVFFDWNSSGKELRRWNNQFKEACRKHGMIFKGLYGPMGQKFNFTWIIESESVDKFIETTKSVIRPPAMTHYITEVLIPQLLDE
ncbi:MAG: hypothetical protein QGF78_02510 [Candidatus Bathyarchaeota archaeon]|jgi:hypothetical protein|nr:hypothetical protein [Candidatus Bathyarchaeota archaeon]|tara:strand:- start:123 stop:386 length:264 start_codon:yes stop_codon:yes gene_type:complete